MPEFAGQGERRDGDAGALGMGQAVAAHLGKAIRPSVPGSQQLDKQDVHDAVAHGAGPRLGSADFAGEQPERGIQGGADLAGGDVQHVREQGEQRHGDRRVLVMEAHRTRVCPGPSPRLRSAPTARARSAARWSNGTVTVPGPLARMAGPVI